MAGLRDSDVHFAPGVGDLGDEDDVPLDPRMEELLGKKKRVNKDEDDVDFDPDKIRRAADEELEAEDLDIKAPADKTQQKTDDGEDEAEKPVDTSDPTYKAALAKYRAAAERKRQKQDRLVARRRAIKQGKAEAMRDVRRRLASEAQQTWWGYLDFGALIDRAKDKIMPRAHRKIVMAAFNEWVFAFAKGWTIIEDYMFSFLTLAIGFGVPFYLVLFQRNLFYEWFVTNHRPDVAMIKARTRIRR